MTEKTITTLGPKEFVDFPDLGLKSVPAKVDTGADSSSIWASDIQEVDGVLRFCLFDRTSPFYTGEVISTSRFKVTSIKNSFGQAEFRYKVRLKAAIGGKTIVVQFTLANRENNRLPILIGRRTLHGKFLVDVARKHATKARRLLLVSVARTSAVDNFLKGVVADSKTDLSVNYITYDDVRFYFQDGMTKIVIAETGEDIASYDIVHFKTWKERDVTAAMAYYLQKRGVKFLDKRTIHFAANSKIYQYVLLNDNGITVPPSVFVMPTQYDTMFDAFKESLDLPFVFKGVAGSRGAHNYLVADERSYKKAVTLMRQDNIVAIAQKFIPNDGDYRVLIFSRHLALIIYRSRKDDTTHLNNTSQGGTASLVPITQLPTKVRQDSITAADLLDLGISGVDMLQDKETGLWYCLEVNGDPQIASGAFVAEKRAAYAQYIETELGK